MKRKFLKTVSALLIVTNEQMLEYTDTLEELKKLGGLSK